MKTMSNYLIIMLSVMLFIFRLIVVFTTTMGIEFAVTSLNVNLEMGLLFVMLICIILISRNKLSGAVILTVSSIAYYGADILQKFTYISQNNVSIDTAMELIISVICVVIPISTISNRNITCFVIITISIEYRFYICFITCKLVRPDIVSLIIVFIGSR